MDKTVVIIGGGPAGLIACARAKQRADKVILVDQNPFMGKKLRITGKGRCNITNIADTDEIIDNITTNKRFMYSALSAFSNYDVIAMLEDLGVKTKVERGGRVFPESDSAKDVAEALIKNAKGENVKFIKAKAKRILIENGQVAGVLCEERKIKCDSVILATGGRSYPLTGSDGSGYKIAKDAGHTITPIVPSLIPLVTKEKWVKDVMGLALKNVKITVKSGDKEIYSDFGEMLFTHFGVSGPIILSASAHIRNFDKNKYILQIDTKPALTEKQLDERILRDFAEAGNKDLINAMDKMLPKAMIPVIIKEADLDEHTKINSLTKQQRLGLVEAMKKLKLTIVGTRPIDEAIVTSGGVECSEINPSTMESKIVNGLYFAGEVIDLDAYTGGFNLQIAFSTGYLAGENA